LSVNYKKAIVKGAPASKNKLNDRGSLFLEINNIYQKFKEFQEWLPSRVLTRRLLSNHSALNYVSFTKVKNWGAGPRCSFVYFTPDSFSYVLPVALSVVWYYQSIWDKLQQYSGSHINW